MGNNKGPDGSWGHRLGSTCQDAPATPELAELNEAAAEG